MQKEAKEGGVQCCHASDDDDDDNFRTRKLYTKLVKASTQTKGARGSVVG